MNSWESKLCQVFSSKVPLTQEELNDFISGWRELKEVKRNDFLIRKDQTETNLYFVLSGTMRIYFPHQDEEICVGFAYEDNLICSYPSFIRDQPSNYFVQALTSTKVVAISKHDFYQLFDRYPKLERAWRLLEEDALIGKIERETEMLTFTPEERLQRLIERSPQIFQKIPRKYIASYLRMKPETLSRISAR